MLDITLESISTKLAAADPSLPLIKIRLLVAERIQQYSAALRLLDQLDNRPELLSTSPPDMPLNLQRLVKALVNEGAVDLQLPECPRCSQRRMLKSFVGDQRVCDSCYSRTRTKYQRCDGCSQNRRMRAEVLGKSYCGGCWDSMKPDAEKVMVRSAAKRNPTINPDAIRQAFANLPGSPASKLRLAHDFDDSEVSWFDEPHQASARFIAFYNHLRRELPELPAVSCGVCGEARKITNRTNGLRCCSRCYRKSMARECDGCGRHSVIERRQPDGAGLCQACTNALPESSSECSICHLTRLIAFQGPNGPVCGPCRVRGFVDVCTGCERERPCRFAGTDRAVCDNCAKRKEACSRCALDRIVSTRDLHGQAICHACKDPIIETCVTCHRDRRVVGRANGRPFCGYCYRLHPSSFRDCDRCGIHAKTRRTGLCDRCTADDKIDSIFPKALLDENPEARAMWASCRLGDATVILNAFNRKRSVKTLAVLLSAPELRSHETLNAIGSDQETRNVRALLVEHGLLPHEDRHLVRFEAWIPEAAQAIPVASERHAFVQFARWQHLRVLRERPSPLPTTATTYRRRELRIVIELLLWAQKRGKTLATLDQADLDRWSTTGRERYRVIKFLRWSHKNRLSKVLVVPGARPSGITVMGMSDEDRAIRLSEVLALESKSPPGTRLAAALVLIYGIRPQQITYLKLDDIETVDGMTHVSIGAAPLILPEELGVVADEVRADRTAWRLLGAVKDQFWLFPGIRPGYPLSSAALVERLAAVGVPPIPARCGALASLSQHLPPIVLAELVGIHVGTAVRWREAMASSSARYAGILLAQDGITPHK